MYRVKSRLKIVERVHSGVISVYLSFLLSDLVYRDKFPGDSFS